MFECELNNSSKKANPSKMVPRKGWSLHEMIFSSQKNCKVYKCIWKEDLGNGWRRYGKSAIKLITEKKNWTDARSHCQSLGGDLLSITSSHENDFVNDVFVESLNLTYIQEKDLSSDHIHFKLNGDDPRVE
ncbi:Perlucin-like protein [Exaiptasia diaphana]|nr:Perlucin-like protein [Exaiptasia diaphana]